MALVGAALFTVSGCALPPSLLMPHAPAPASAAVPAPTNQAAPGASTDPGVPSDLDWTPVTDPATGITVRLPGPAQHQTKPFTNASGQSTIADIYISTFGAAGYTEQMYISGIPRALTSTELTTLYEQQAAAQSGSVTSSTPITVNGYQGVDVRMTIVDEGRQADLYARAVCTPTTMVQLLTEGLAGDPFAETVHDQAVQSLTVP